MKQKIIYFFSIIIFSIFIYLFFQNNPELFSKFLEISLKNILIIFSLNTLLLFINGYFLKTITLPFNINIKNHFWISSTTSLLNLITPFRGGAFFRGWYLKKKYNLPIKDILITIAGSYPIIFLINSILGIFLLTYLFQSGISNSIWGFVFFSILFLSTLILFFIPQIKYKKLEKLNFIIQGWHKISKNKKIIFICTLQQLLFSSVSALALFFIFKSIGYDISIAQALLISVFAVFAIIINITPAGLGIVESFFILAGIFINVPVEIMLLSVIVRRSIEIFTLLFWGGLGKFILLKDLKIKNK